MRSVIALVLVFLSLSTLTQAQEWEKTKIDSIVSVDLPKGFTETTTNGKYNLVAVSPWGTILIFKTPDDPKVTPDIEKDKHLTRYYNDYIKTIRSVSANGIVKDEKDGLLGELKIKDFTLQLDTGSGVLFRDFRLLHADGATYVFEYLHQDIHSHFAIPEKEKFFSSIQVSEKTVKADQYTAGTGEGGSSRPNLTIWILAGGLAVVLAIVLALRRRRTA